MNKHYLVLFLGIIFHWGFAQQWVDSIDAARQAYHKKNYADAERIYKSQYEKAKSKGGIDEELAQTKYRQRDYKGAIHFYQKKLKSVKNKTEKARIKHNLGNSYFEKGDYAKAIKAYKEEMQDDEDTINESIKNNEKFCLKHSDKNIEICIKRLCKYCDIEQDSKYICHLYYQ